jgi:hypothetical protein
MTGELNPRLSLTRSELQNIGRALDDDGRRNAETNPSEDGRISGGLGQ